MVVLLYFRKNITELLTPAPVAVKAVCGKYEEQKNLEDYDIFMAIAEEIGYDATGKPTQNNELDYAPLTH
jgi:hypothetical protein